MTIIPIIVIIIIQHAYDDHDDHDHADAAAVDDDHHHHHQHHHPESYCCGSNTSDIEQNSETKNRAGNPFEPRPPRLLAYTIATLPRRLLY